MFISYRHVSIIGLLVAGALGGAALAQTQTPPAPPPGQKQPTPPQTGGGGGEPGGADQPQSLDDLLGITPEKHDAGAPGAPGAPGDGDAAERDRSDQLERALTEKRITDAFLVALEKMGVSADLLGKKEDPGLGTQRIQEEILAKLDELIEQAGKSPKGSSSSSSGSKSQPQSQKPSSKPSSSPNQGSHGDNRGEKIPPPMQQGDINTVIDESRSEWGNLPERVRDLMMQGQGGYKSILYRKLTDEYYKRLAEDGSS